MVSKAAEDRRTSKPGGKLLRSIPRDSVLDCGGPAAFPILIEINSARISVASQFAAV
jgi:hypothetical protein